MLPVTRVSWN